MVGSSRDARSATARRRGVTLAVVAALSVPGLTGGPLAQVGTPADPGPVLRPGTYVGELRLEFDGLEANLPEGRAVSYGSFSGHLEFTVDDDQVVEGRFGYGGSWTMDLTIPEGTGRVSADTSAHGLLDGDGSEITLTGIETTVGESVVNGISFPIEDEDLLPEIVMTVELVSCNEVHGSWEQRWQGIAAEAGYDNPQAVTGEFWAVRVDPEDEAERIDALFDRWMRDPRDPGADPDRTGLPEIAQKYSSLLGRSIEAIVSASDQGLPLAPETFDSLLAEGEALAEEMRAIDPCVAELLDAAQIDRVVSWPARFTAAMIDNVEWLGFEGWSPIEIRDLALTAIKHGVVGPKAYSAEVADQATATFKNWAESVINEHFLINPTGDGRDGFANVNDTLEALIVAAALGIETLTVGPNDFPLSPKRALLKNADLIVWDTGEHG